MNSIRPYSLQAAASLTARISASTTILPASDGSVTYTGKFKAIYDGTGKNLAPSGAGQLTLSHAGKLVSFR